jgi:positive regulator of sigma E activity
MRVLISLIALVSLVISAWMSAEAGKLESMQTLTILAAFTLVWLGVEFISFFREAIRERREMLEYLEKSRKGRLK